MPPLSPEVLWLAAGVVAYVFGTVCAMGDQPRGVLFWVTVGVALLTVAVAVRWSRLEYGPFLTLFEVLLSNVFSLGLIYALLYWRVPSLRGGARFALPVLVLLGAWALSADPSPARLPATYDNPWLWVHVLSGKAFLGLALAGAGLAAHLWLRAPAGGTVADSTLWAVMAAAFVFQTLMILAGAAWARDAWGRFWSWDPLETWSLVTWLVLAGVLHARLAWAMPRWLGLALTVGVFMLAVLTFLGVPFLSVSAHKGIL